MSQEIRNDIIREYLPKLIKDLTGFEDNDENTRRCENFAWSIIRNHRNLSTNSHEVKRKIDGIQEKFNVDNCKTYADHLGLLCEEITRHPLCLEHYEVDVHWSLLDFLFTLAYNPTGALKRNKYKIDLTHKHDEENAEQSETSYWKNVLKEDFIPLESVKYTDSDLSDWSDSDSNNDGNDYVSDDARQADSSIQTKSYKLQSNTLANIKPPEKQKHYKLFDSKRSTEYLLAHVQNTWWLPGAQNAQVSARLKTEANFAYVYNVFLNEQSNNLLRFPELSTATEFCLMREILWMFHSPVNSKFFSLDSKHGIVMRDVTIPSVTVYGLSNYLNQHILPYIRMMSKLRSFLDSIYKSDMNAPKTIECYAANLRTLLDPVWQKILQFESGLIEQHDLEINTLLQLHYILKDAFSMLECIYDIHSQAVLKQFPAHILSSYLLASLMQSNEIASRATNANLAVSLFLTSIKSFCNIIDTWWTGGILEDWRQEFIVEKSNYADDYVVRVRPFSKNDEKYFFVPLNISKTIKKNRCFELLLEHSLEAGCTLNLLYAINRIGDLRNACEAIEGKLYNQFIDDVLIYIEKLQSEIITEEDCDAECKENIDNENCIISSNESHLDNITTTDEFLLMAFAASPYQSKNVDLEKSNLNAYDIFKQLEKTSKMLPLEELVQTSLTRILKTRIAFANNFVMKMYREQFVILTHLRNIRKVLLLEASDLMHQFYDTLFKKIESGQPWRNAALLTMQLDDILCSKFPEMSSLFHIELKLSIEEQLQNKIFEAVEDLKVHYSFGKELSQIVNDSDIEQYNIVFRFLLKVKYGLSTLENLQFPRSHKHRVPYCNFEMIDLQMRRLEQLRFWMIYAIQSIHFHLMTHVLQSMGEQLDEKISNCTNLKQLVTVHKSYISTVCEHCFLVEDFKRIKTGIDQLLNLTSVVSLEWNSCTKYIECNNPLAIDDTTSEESEGDYISSIDEIELTYIRVHQYLANKLNDEVYLNQKAFLSGLSAAFNTSLPY